MSAQNFRVGDPIDSQVAKKIKNLQKTFGEKTDGQSRLNYIELQSATPWIRMQSGVRLSEDLAAKYSATGGYGLAKKNVLFGLNARIENTATVDGKEVTQVLYTPNQGDPIGYDYDSTYGFGHRPKPGILDMSIHSHNRFGSLRTAVVKFQCWTREQMDALEILFMRPGYSVLLEWGHSKILKVDGSGVIDMDAGINLYQDGLDTATAIRNRIVSKRDELQYGYDAILGVIKNFSWQLRPDGGYDCTTHLVTSGEIIESYKANFYLKQDLIAEDLQATYTEVVQDSPIEEIIWPTLYKDNDSDVYPDLGPIEAKIDQWVSQAEQAMTATAAALETFKGAKTNQELADLLKNNMGNAIGQKVTIGNAKEAAEVIIKIINNLKIVRGGSGAGNDGQFLYNGKKRVRYSTNAGKFTYQKIFEQDFPVNIKSPWKWLVDFNQTGNGFRKGETPNFDFPGGARAGWMFTNVVNGGNLCLELLKAVGAGGKDSSARFSDGQNLNPIFTVLEGVLNIVKKVRVDASGNYNYDNQGNQVFFFDGSTASNPQGTGTYLETNENRSKFLTNLKNQAPAGANFDFNIVAKDTLNSKVLYGKNVTAANDPNAKIGDKWDTVAPEDNQAHLTIQFKQVTQFPPEGVARFAVVNWTGFDPQKAAQGTVVTQTDEDTGATFVYYDPNDDYTSKLHYYLRTKLETPYHKSYLDQDFGGRDFVSTFQYRTAPDGLIDELFDENLAPTLRSAVPKEVRDGMATILGGRFVSDQDLELRDHVYIKLGALLELINKHMLRSDSEYFFTFQTSYGTSKYPKYFTFDDHISIDPRICILPHTTEKLGVVGAGDQSPKILNIELSVNFILDTLNRYINTDGSVAVYDYIQDILNGIVKATGGVNDYQLQYMEDNAVYHIVDRRVIAPNSITSFGDGKFTIYGLDSIIKDVNLVSKLTPKISSMIAISAQANPYTSMDEASGFNAINRGMTDRIYTKRYDVESKETKDSVEEGKIKAYNEFRDKLKSDIIGLITHLGLFYSKCTVPRNSADTQYGVYENYCKFLLGGKVIFEHKGRATYNFVLPFELQLKTYGISGLKVMDAFLVDQSVLPKTYGGDADKPVGFLITGVEHSVNRQEWSTTLKSQIFNIGEDYQTGKSFTDLKQDLVDSVAGLQFDTGFRGGGGGTPQPGTRGKIFPGDCDNPGTPPQQQAITTGGTVTHQGILIKTKGFDTTQINNIKTIIDISIKGGITSKATIIGMLCTIGKESNFKPKFENINYTSHRALAIDGWQSHFKKYFKAIGKTVPGNLVEKFTQDKQFADTLTDTGKRLMPLVFNGGTNKKGHYKLKDETAKSLFMDIVYGYYREPKKQYGNDQKGDGYKYRGGGFNQITFKGSYEKAGERVKALFGETIDYLGTPANVNDPEKGAKATVAFFNHRFRNSQKIDPNQITDPEIGVIHAVAANKGGSMPPCDIRNAPASGLDFQRSYRNAMKYLPHFEIA